jgi:phage-related protein
MISAARPVRWFMPSRDEIRDLPTDVRQEIGFRIRRIQNGEYHSDRSIKPFGEDSRIRHLIKIVTDGDDGNTYRTAVVAEFDEGLWILDVFEKRSVSGISTPKKDIDRIADRYGRLKTFRETAVGQQMISEMKLERQADQARINLLEKRKQSRP